MLDHYRDTPTITVRSEAPALAPPPATPVARAFVAHDSRLSWRPFIASVLILALLASTGVLAWSYSATSNQLVLANAAIQDRNAQINQLRGQLDAANASLQSTKTDLAVAQDALKKSQADLAASVAQQQDTATKLLAANSQIAQLNGQLGSAQQQTAEASSQVQQLQANQHPTATRIGCTLGAIGPLFGIPSHGCN